MAKRMKTTLLIFATMLLVGSADAVGAKKRAQDNTERNPAVSAKEGDGVKNGARDKGPVVAIKKFVPAPGAVAEFELAYDECPTNAIELYQSKAESGDSKAQYFVAKALLFGIGCGKDENTAVKWAAKSADSGFAPAISLLGCCYQSGCGIEKDCLMAAELFEKSSSMGSLSGKYNIGLCYVKGDGVEKNEGKGMKLIEEAAVAGFPAAMVEMGQGCRRKFNVTKDYEFRKKARNWFRKAMEAGNEEGKWRFVMTWGVTDRWEESPTVEDHEILRNACLAVADDGLTSYQKYLKGDMRAYACFTIGNMAETGWGQEKDLILALEWYEKAARLSSSYDSDLRRLREELEKKYSLATIASMRKRLRQKASASSGSNGFKKDGGTNSSSQLFSFCGIKFGDELPKTPVFGDQRTKDGKSLMRMVKLQKPFQGMDHATVFASIKTRKICCVRLEWTKEGLEDDEVPEGKSVANAVRNRYPDAEKISHDMPDGFMNLYSEEYKVGGGKVSIEWVQRDFMHPPTRLQLTARNDEFMRLAEEEYNQESGGDGSSVL